MVPQSMGFLMRHHLARSILRTTSHTLFHLQLFKTVLICHWLNEPRCFTEGSVKSRYLLPLSVASTSSTRSSSRTSREARERLILRSLITNLSFIACAHSSTRWRSHKQKLFTLMRLYLHSAHSDQRGGPTRRIASESMTRT